MDFFSVVLFLMIYYIRPQEWAGFLSGFHPVTMIMVFALAAMVMKEREFTIKDFFQTPHDWVMFGWVFYTVWASPEHRETFGDVKNFLLFYLVIVQALSTVGRIEQFLKWWIIMIMVLVGLALGSKFGFDPLGSKDLTESIKGRLSVNLSIFANPNALGHAIVPVIPLLYFMFAWNRPIFMKQAAVVLILIPAYCAFLTESKGAFLSGFGTTVLSMTFGRPKIIQVFIIWAALTAGWAGLHQLPRMDSMGKLGADKGVQGRLLSFRFGYTIFKTEKWGVGYHNWFKAQYQALHLYYAAHSAFVMVGAELGFTGLMLYLGLAYCGLRTLVTARNLSIEEERIRRMLFVLIVSYLITGWMLNVEYTPYYFITVATMAAFHRCLIAKQNPQPATETSATVIVPELVPAAAGMSPQPAPVIGSLVATMAGPTRAEAESGRRPWGRREDDEAGLEPSIRWNRLSLVDVALMWGIAEAAGRFWGYICKSL